MHMPGDVSFVLDNARFFLSGLCRIMVPAVAQHLQFPDCEVELVQEGRDFGVSAKLGDDDRVTVDVEFGDALTFVFSHIWLDAPWSGSVPAGPLVGVLSVQWRLWISCPASPRRSGALWIR